MIFHHFPLISRYRYFFPSSGIWNLCLSIDHTAYKTESADCEKCQEQIKIQNRQNYEKYHEGQMNQNQFMEAKKQLEEERERLQKRVQELDELINDEKEILMKKNVPVEQMLKYLGYENLTREMLEEYVQGIYVYDDGRVEVEYK